ncbi:MAG: hypothetical protein HY698_17115 [Deltaproteobacteria bacterium]|nr:hypothetical protein [Deltaproteobacteria bacterium]
MGAGDGSSRRAWQWRGWILVFAFLAMAPPAWAEDFFKSSPGRLSASHSSLDGRDKCDECHGGSKKVVSGKCVGCHDHSDQKAKIESGKGFHASPKVAGRNCGTCHREHKGLSADIMGWAAIGGRAHFDHSLTAFPLGGKHKITECDSCHARKNQAGNRLYLGEPRECDACHREDQPHELKTESRLACSRCHSEVAWKPTKATLDFDHRDKAKVGLVLEGNHVDVACVKCHPEARFDLPGDSFPCSACHENPHKGHLFGKSPCDSCHSPKHRSLSMVEFDHARKTRFPLEGKHARARCASCHVPEKSTVPQHDCEACHAKDSRHGERFSAFGSPPACGTCHPGTSFEPSVFNHDTRARFRLTGKHARVPCRSCHRGAEPHAWERFDLEKDGCTGCHKHADVHGRKFKASECLGCHQMGGVIETSARAKARFHGKGARFPLGLGHARVLCRSCHGEDKWKGVSAECGSACHEDSLHRGSLGAQCTRCHSGGTWAATRFDHEEDSTYPLRGRHEGVRCDACHPQRAFKPTPTTCSAKGCHLDDDAHSAKLGSSCDRCHRVTGENVFTHNTQSPFLIENAHLKVECKECHKSLEFKPVARDCSGCHPEPAVHKGKYGTRCVSCHDTVSWKRIRPVHDVGTFSLAGAHKEPSCERCHKDWRPLAGTGALCVGCHRADDLHAGSLGPGCGECHSQWAFAPARFDHVGVGCDLRGQHRVLPCFSCHKAGNFGGLLGDCFSCHRDDALSAGNKRLDHRALIRCGDCHGVNTWYPASSSPASSSVCR